MSEYNKTILTNEGIDLARRANKGTATFSLTRGVSSTDNLSEKTVEELQNLTQLPSIQQSVKLSDVGDTSDNSDTVLGVRMTFDNQNLKTGYNVHTVGIYAKEPDKNEILYGIATAKTPEYIPDFSEQTLFKFDFLMYLVIGRTDKVTVEVSPDDVYRKKEVYSKSEVDTAVAKLDKKNAEIVKSLSDYKLENSTYHTNFEKSVTDRLGTKADKTTVEQQLGTKADKSNTYTKDEVNSKVAPKADKGYVDSELNKKADKATTYTKTEVDNKIAGQVKSVNGHTANASGAVTLPTLTANVLTGYDVKNKAATFDNNAHFDANGLFSRWTVDQGVIGQLADAINAKLPIEAGDPNGDLLDYAGNKIVYWNGNGDGVKNLPPMNNKKWFFAVKLFYLGWGSVTVVDQDGSYWLNTKNDDIWTGWRSVITNEHLKKLKFVKQSLDQNGNIFQDTKFVTQEADGTYKINIFDSDWTANKVSWLLNNTKSYSIQNNTDLNNVKNTGFYNAAGPSGLKNSPVSAWFSMSVNANQWNGQQTLYDTNSGQLYVRTWNSTRFTDWQRIANAGDLTNQSITSITDYDVASEGWHNTQVGKFDPSGHFANLLVDAGALKPIAEAINNLNTNLTTMRTELMNLKKRTDYNTPQGEFNNTTVNLNNLRSTGMYRLSNCHVQSGPYPTDNAHWVYVKVTVFDANTVYQTLYEGDNMYGRKSSSPTNWDQWHQYLNKTV
ncbi:pyocin knob domain-containing protein [Lactobacillus gasseri]|uniref:pyocin knob domain-containing protein n=1 Tax=Lactobacillus gasseri TaxID=1596 RepID=UPI003A80A527